MSVYTVHEPPLRAADALADPTRFAFVRDGFYWWAFLLTPFWMLRHRLWLVLVIYLLVSAGFEGALRIVGASAGAIALVAILISLLVGLEASTLRRFTLKRRRWRNVGIVSGDDLEDAELRFFDAWLREAPARNAAPPVAPQPPPVAPAPRMSETSGSETSGVIGLFPEPGAQR
jgi:Protein of unknown function (DUF2628)